VTIEPDQAVIGKLVEERSTIEERIRLLDDTRDAADADHKVSGGDDFGARMSELRSQLEQVERMIAKLDSGME
jgi:hypothetical protein